MIHFRNCSLTEAILAKKAEIKDIENRLAAPAPGPVFVYGRWMHRGLSPRSRKALIDKKAHLELVVREWETEQLLGAHRASLANHNLEACLAIEKKLADLGVCLREPAKVVLQNQATAVDAPMSGNQPLRPQTESTGIPALNSSTTSATPIPPARMGRIDLGKTIDALYQELRCLSVFSRGRRKTESELRSRFPDLQVWVEIDESSSLPSLERERFFSRRLDSYGKTKFMEFIGRIAALEGATAYTIWKEYRRHAGLRRKRSASKEPCKSADPSSQPQP